MSGLREVGRYRVLAELGRGGMGRVLLGYGPDGRLVALKLVHEQFAEDDGFRARFRREVEASRAVSGAYTAAVVDADPDAPTPWLASVFVPGPSLHDAVQTAGALPEEPVLRLAAGLATALIQIHRAELVHRDLKPSNVLLADDGPRVIDFGLVRAVNGGRSGDLTRAGWLVGSPPFMSPEQAKGEQVTPASDVFSLGSVVVAACTGASPFTDTATLQTMNNVVHTDPDLTRVATAIRRIVQPCLAKNPADRPTPAELLESIGPVAPSARPWPAAVHQLIAQRHADITRLVDPSHAPTVITSDSPPTLTATRVDTGPPPEPTGESPARGRRARRPWLRLGTVTTALALAGVLVWTLWPAPQTSPQTSPSPQTTSAPRLLGVSVMTGSAQALGVWFSPDGRTVATSYGDQTVQLGDVAGKQPVGQILGPFGDHGVSDVAFSPDNRTLITARVDGDDSVVQLWDVASGHQIGQPFIVEGIDTRFVWPTLSPDGRFLAVAAPFEDTTDVQLWDVAGRQRTGRIDTSPNVQSAVFSPDGRTILIRDWDATGISPLMLWDVASKQPVGNPINLPRGDDLSTYTFSPDGDVLVTVGGNDNAGTVRLWDTSSHNQIRQPITIPGGSPDRVALSPDGHTLATASDDGILNLWNVDSGRQIGSAIDGINGIAFSPDGRTLATAGHDHAVRLWSVPGS